MNKTQKKDDLVEFMQKVDLKNQHIKARIGELAGKGFIFEIFIWYGILIEANLSIYLAIHEELIHDVGEIFGLSLQQYTPCDIKQYRSGYTLGKLIANFKKISANKNLISKLERFNTNRNNIVHRFIDKGFKVGGASDLQSENEKISELLTELHSELDSLMEEMLKVGKRREKQLKKKLRKLESGIE